jgi:hypothetical protein
MSILPKRWFISTRTSPARRKHLGGLLRAFGYASAVAIVFGGLQVRAARAEMKDRTLEIGRQMMRLTEPSQHEVHKIALNGQAMWVSSAVANGSVSSILDRYESYCQKDLAQPAEGWRALADKADASVDTSFLSTGTMRGGGTDEGSVVCFTKTSTSKPTVTEAIDTLGKTGELGALGAVRYVYARTTAQGSTFVLTAWTDDHFNLVDLMPKEGADVPGADFAEMPRVPNAHRVLSTSIEGSPYGVNVYRGAEAPSKVMDFYDAEMKQRGWLVYDPEVPEKDLKRPALLRLFEKDGVVLNLTSYTAEGATFTALGLAGVGSTDGKASSR